MDLITPGSGLIFWQLFGFLGLLFILIKFAWKPMLSALEERESSIENSLKAAESARNEMANLKADNEKLLAEARLERDTILKKAQEVSVKMIEEAKNEAAKVAAQQIENAKAVIETEKKAALAEVKTQVAFLTLEVTEKLLRKNLSEDKAQKAYFQYPTPDIKSSVQLIAPIIPFDITFKIDGIQGFRYGDVLTFDVLPQKYRFNTVFSIVGVNHQVSQDSTWTTEVRCIMRPKVG